MKRHVTQKHIAEMLTIRTAGCKTSQMLNKRDRINLTLLPFASSLFTSCDGTEVTETERDQTVQCRDIILPTPQNRLNHAETIQPEEAVEVGEAFDTREWQLATNVFDSAVKEHMC